MREAGPGGDPLDLLDTGTARQLAAGPAASQQAGAADRPSFARQGGKLLVRDDRDVIKDTADPAGRLTLPHPCRPASGHGARACLQQRAWTMLWLKHLTCFVCMGQVRLVTRMLRTGCCCA